MSYWSKLSYLVGFLARSEFTACLLAFFVAAILAIAATLVRNVGDASSRAQRRTVAIVLLLLSGLVVAFGGSLFLVRIGRWGYLLALLPGIAIGRHAIYMRLIRRRTLSAPVAMPPGLRRPRPSGDEADGGTLELEDPGLLVVFARARQMHDRDFAPDTLVARFGIPALLTTFIGIGVFEFLHTAVATLFISPQVVHAAWFGAAGAMVYVLLYLGQRAFRSDITTGGALWSAIVLALGPVFGAVFSLIWTDHPQVAGAAATATAAFIPSHDALYFVAGMAPRHAASAVEEAVRRLWLARAPSTQAQSRLQPLAQLRGVTPAIEDRLAEEGIADVQGMAMADPLRLFRSTSFDKRQILSWMDEALLMSWLPDHWTALQKVGITGAIDLMAHVLQREVPLRAVLAGAAHLDQAAVDAVILAGKVLKEDTQLRLVWALYQFDEDALEGSTVDPADAPGSGFSTAGAAGPPGLAWLLGALALALAAGAVGDVTVAVGHVVILAAFLVVASAIALTARWPWKSGAARSLPLLVAALLVGGALVAHRTAWPVGEWLWRLRGILAVASVACLGVFLAGVLAGAVGGTLSIDFPYGAPAVCELWVADRAVDITRPTTTPTVCPVAGCRVEVVVRSAGMEQRRWLDARGQRATRISFPLPAAVIVQPHPPEAMVLRLWVDGVETTVGPLELWPRAVPYDIAVEASGFLLAASRIMVTTAETISLPVQLQTQPPGRPPGAEAMPAPGALEIPVDPSAIRMMDAPRKPDAPPATPQRDDPLADDKA